MMKKKQSYQISLLLLSVALYVPSWCHAQSAVGTFSSVVTIQGPVTQTATGNNVTQDLNVGSVKNSKTNNFSSVVTTGGITQTGNNAAQQFINIGSMKDSKADRFDANVQVGRIEQVGRNGERQELDIGSVNNSTVKGAASTSVQVKGGIKQVGSGEIVLGSVKNSNVQQFNSNLNIQGRIEGNNIRMGSVVGQYGYDNNGRIIDVVQADGDQASIFKMPILQNEKVSIRQRVGAEALAIGSMVTTLPISFVSGVIKSPAEVPAILQGLMWGVLESSTARLIAGKRKFDSDGFIPAIFSNYDLVGNKAFDKGFNSGYENIKNDVLNKYYINKTSSITSQLDDARIFYANLATRNAYCAGSGDIELCNNLIEKSLIDKEIYSSVMRNGLLVSDTLLSLLSPGRNVNKFDELINLKTTKILKGDQAATDLLINESKLVQAGEKINPVGIGMKLRPDQIGMNEEMVAKIASFADKGIKLGGKNYIFEIVFRKSNNALDFLQNKLAVLKPSFIKNKSGKNEDWLLMPDEVRNQYGSFDNFKVLGGNKKVNMYVPVEPDILLVRYKELSKTEKRDFDFSNAEKLMKDRVREFGETDILDLEKNGFYLDEKTASIREINTQKFIVSDFDSVAILCKPVKCTNNEIDIISSKLQNEKLVRNETILNHNPSTGNWSKDLDKRFDQVSKDLRETNYSIKSNGDIIKGEYVVYGDLSGATMLIPAAVISGEN